MKQALIIEDDEPTRFTLQEIFASYFPDYKLHILKDSCNYRQDIQSISGTIDLAIIDIYLSICVPGNFVMQWMRATKPFTQTVIIAFTADSLLEGKQLLNEGFDAVIIKPIKDIDKFARQVKLALAGEKFVDNS